MRTVSVVIPYYQSEAGVLGRALRSVEAQDLPADWRLLVVVVDDGSPAPAKRELDGFELTEPRYLKLVEQKNAGVGAARNRGLDVAIPESDAIAFLDSDDIWPADHLRRAIEALDAGFDFYFTDNSRAGSHDSYIWSPYGARTAKLIAQLSEKTGIIELPRDDMVGCCLREFPCQASTIVYRKTVVPDLRFNTVLKSSGEDVLFFTALLASANRIAFDLDSIVVCGEGLNIYFGHLGWDAPRFLSIKVDQLLTYRTLSRSNFISTNNKALSDELVRALTDQLSYHLIRNMLKKPKNAAREAWRLARTDIGGLGAVLSAIPKTIIAKLQGKPIPVSAD